MRAPRSPRGRLAGDVSLERLDLTPEVRSEIVVWPGTKRYLRSILPALFGRLLRFGSLRGAAASVAFNGRAVTARRRDRARRWREPTTRSHAQRDRVVRKAV